MRAIALPIVAVLLSTMSTSAQQVPAPITDSALVGVHRTDQVSKKEVPAQIAKNEPRSRTASGWPPEAIINDAYGAYEKAYRDQVPLTILFAADWCNYCFMMQAGALSDPRVARLWTHGVFLVLDVETDDKYGNTKQIMTRLGITEYPAFAVLEVFPNGVNLRGRIVGYHTPEQFWSSLQQVMPAGWAERDRPGKPETSLPPSLPETPDPINPDIDDYLRGRKR